MPVPSQRVGVIEGRALRESSPKTATCVQVCIHVSAQGLGPRGRTPNAASIPLVLSYASLIVLFSLIDIIGCTSLPACAHESCFTVKPVR